MTFYVHPKHVTCFTVVYLRLKTGVSECYGNRPIHVVLPNLSNYINIIITYSMLSTVRSERRSESEGVSESESERDRKSYTCRL